MKTFKIYVRLNNRWLWITASGNDIIQAKDIARRMYGNDIAFYQYEVI